MKRIKQELLLLWQMPQLILCLLVGVFFEALGRVKEKTWIDDPLDDIPAWYISPMSGAFSLGLAVFIHDTLRSDAVRRHEYGHCLQSRILGPFYLLVIGIPSLLWAAYHTAFRPKRSYYWFYTERWANKLGGVE